MSNIDSYFVWPETEISVTKVSRTQIPDVMPRKGLLSHCGYKVGMNSNLSVSQRRAILREVFLHSLPNMQDEEYAQQWGEPKSAQRLKKLAKSIAAFARNAKHKNASGSFDRAISHWESDLNYLKKTFYEGRFDFRWPSSRIRKGH